METKNINPVPLWALAEKREAEVFYIIYIITYKRKTNQILTLELVL